MNTLRTLSAVGLVLVTGLVCRAEDLLPRDRPIGEVIDHYVDAKLREAKVTPAPQVPDATLVRRLTLDLVGRIPAAAEARLHARGPLDKKKLIDALASSPGFARHNANEFEVLLRNNNADAVSVRAYLLDAFKENRPWDAMFRDLIGAQDKPMKTRPEAFVLKRLKDPDALTRDVSSVFFGLNITCAQCHRHPEIKDLTQDYFFGMRAFFASSYDFQGNLLERRHVKFGDFKDKNGETRKVSMMFLSGTRVEAEALPEKELLAAIQAESKLIQEKAKAYAKTKELPPEPKFGNRKQLAKLALDVAHREMFARSIVNRLWFRFYGHGLVMRVDQMHTKNEASHPELLRWLTRDLIEHDYDLKRLIAGLVSSRAYARSSQWKGEAPPRDLFALAVIRPLTPAQWSLSYRVAGDPQPYEFTGTEEARRKRIDELESKTGVVTFIEQPREDFHIGIDEPLKLSNDEGLIKGTGDKLVALLRKLPDPRRQIEEAVWAILSRPATQEDLELFGEYLEERKARPEEALRQMVWALINSPEFRFNH